jgi:hypothetical protein
MKIVLLYFEGCPNAEPTRALVERILAEEGLAAELQRIEINDLETARAWRFLGSPTVQVNGVDIEPARRTDANYALACRVYATQQGAVGVPPADRIRAALRSGIGASSRE